MASNCCLGDILHVSILKLQKQLQPIKSIQSVFEMVQIIIEKEMRIQNKNVSKTTPETANVRSPLPRVLFVTSFADVTNSQACVLTCHHNRWFHLICISTRFFSLASVVESATVKEISGPRPASLN